MKFQKCDEEIPVYRKGLEYYLVVNDEEVGHVEVNFLFLNMIDYENCFAEFWRTLGKCIRLTKEEVKEIEEEIMKEFPPREQFINILNNLNKEKLIYLLYCDDDEIKTFAQKIANIMGWAATIQKYFGGGAQRWVCVEGNDAVIMQRRHFGDGWGPDSWEVIEIGRVPLPPKFRIEEEKEER